ncbi:translation initiation factor IF-2, partial [Elysia marginata]
DHSQSHKEVPVQENNLDPDVNKTLETDEASRPMEVHIETQPQDTSYVQLNAEDHDTERPAIKTSSDQKLVWRSRSKSADRGRFHRSPSLGKPHARAKTAASATSGSVAPSFHRSPSLGKPHARAKTAASATSGSVAPSNTEVSEDKAATAYSNLQASVTNRPPKAPSSINTASRAKVNKSGNQYLGCLLKATLLCVCLCVRTEPKSRCQSSGVEDPSKETSMSSAKQTPVPKPRSIAAAPAVKPRQILKDQQVTSSSQLISQEPQSPSAVKIPSFSTIPDIAESGGHLTRLATIDKTQGQNCASPEKNVKPKCERRSRVTRAWILGQQLTSNSSGSKQIYVSAGSIEPCGSELLQDQDLSQKFYSEPYQNVISSLVENDKSRSGLSKARKRNEEMSHFKEKVDTFDPIRRRFSGAVFIDSKTGSTSREQSRCRKLCDSRQCCSISCQEYSPSGDCKSPTSLGSKHKSIEKEFETNVAETSYPKPFTPKLPLEFSKSHRVSLCKQQDGNVLYTTQEKSSGDSIQRPPVYKLGCVAALSPKGILHDQGVKHAPENQNSFTEKKMERSKNTVSKPCMPDASPSSKQCSLSKRRSQRLRFKHQLSREDGDGDRLTKSKLFLPGTSRRNRERGKSPSSSTEATLHGFKTVDNFGTPSKLIISEQVGRANKTSNKSGEESVQRTTDIIQSLDGTSLNERAENLSAGLPSSPSPDNEKQITSEGRVSRMSDGEDESGTTADMQSLITDENDGYSYTQSQRSGSNDDKNEPSTSRNVMEVSMESNENDLYWPDREGDQEPQHRLSHTEKIYDQHGNDELSSYASAYDSIPKSSQQHRTSKQNDRSSISEYEARQRRTKGSSGYVSKNVCENQSSFYEESVDSGSGNSFKPSREYRDNQSARKRSPKRSEKKSSKVTNDRHRRSDKRKKSSLSDEDDEVNSERKGKSLTRAHSINKKLQASVGPDTARRARSYGGARQRRTILQKVIDSTHEVLTFIGRSLKPFDLMARPQICDGSFEHDTAQPISVSSENSKSQASGSALRKRSTLAPEADGNAEPKSKTQEEADRCARRHGWLSMNSLYPGRDPLCDEDYEMIILPTLDMARECCYREEKTGKGLEDRSPARYSSPARFGENSPQICIDIPCAFSAINTSLMMQSAINRYRCYENPCQMYKQNQDTVNGDRIHLSSKPASEVEKVASDKSLAEREDSDSSSGDRPNEETSELSQEEESTPYQPRSWHSEKKEPSPDRHYFKKETLDIVRNKKLAAYKTLAGKKANLQNNALGTSSSPWRFSKCELNSAGDLNPPEARELNHTTITTANSTVLSAPGCLENLPCLVGHTPQPCQSASVERCELNKTCTPQIETGEKSCIGAGINASFQGKEFDVYLKYSDVQNFQHCTQLTGGSTEVNCLVSPNFVSNDTDLVNFDSTSCDNSVKQRREELLSGWVDFVVQAFEPRESRSTTRTCRWVGRSVEFSPSVTKSRDTNKTRSRSVDTQLYHNISQNQSCSPDHVTDQSFVDCWNSRDQYQHGSDRKPTAFGLNFVDHHVESKTFDHEQNRPHSANDIETLSKDEFIIHHNMSMNKNEPAPAPQRRSVAAGVPQPPGSRPQHPPGQRPEPPAGSRPQPSQGQRPEPPAGSRSQHPPGQRPEPPAGSKPQHPPGQRPEPPAGSRPQHPPGQRPEPPAGSRPQHPPGQRPEPPAGSRPQPSAGPSEPPGPGERGMPQGPQTGPAKPPSGPPSSGAGLSPGLPNAPKEDTEPSTSFHDAHSYSEAEKEKTPRDLMSEKSMKSGLEDNTDNEEFKEAQRHPKPNLSEIPQKPDKFSEAAGSQKSHHRQGPPDAMGAHAAGRSQHPPSRSADQPNSSPGIKSYKADQLEFDPDDQRSPNLVIPLSRTSSGNRIKAKEESQPEGTDEDVSKGSKSKAKSGIETETSTKSVSYADQDDKCGKIKYGKESGFSSNSQQDESECKKACSDDRSGSRSCSVGRDKNQMPTRTRVNTGTRPCRETISKQSPCTSSEHEACGNSEREQCSRKQTYQTRCKRQAFGAQRNRCVVSDPRITRRCYCGTCQPQKSCGQTRGNQRRSDRELSNDKCFWECRSRVSSATPSPGKDHTTRRQHNFTEPGYPEIETTRQSHTDACQDDACPAPRSRCRSTSQTRAREFFQSHPDWRLPEDTEIDFETDTPRRSRSGCVRNSPFERDCFRPSPSPRGRNRLDMSDDSVYSDSPTQGRRTSSSPRSPASSRGRRFYESSPALCLKSERDSDLSPHPRDSGQSAMRRIRPGRESRATRDYQPSPASCVSRQRAAFNKTSRQKTASKRQRRASLQPCFSSSAPHARWGRRSRAQVAAAAGAAGGTQPVAFVDQFCYDDTGYVGAAGSQGFAGIYPDVSSRRACVRKISFLGLRGGHVIDVRLEMWTVAAAVAVAAAEAVVVAVVVVVVVVVVHSSSSSSSSSSIAAPPLKKRGEDMAKEVEEKPTPPGVLIFQIAARYATFGGIRVAGGVRVIMDAPEKMGYVQIVSPLGQPFITHHVNTMGFLHSSSAAGVAWSAIIWEPADEEANNNKKARKKQDTNNDGRVDSAQVIFCEPYQAHRFRAVLETIKAAFSGGDGALVTPNVPPIPPANNPFSPCNPCNPCPDPCTPSPYANPCAPDPCTAGMATDPCNPCALPFPPPHPEVYGGNGVTSCCAPPVCGQPCASHPCTSGVCPPPFCSQFCGSTMCAPPCMTPCPIPLPASCPGQCPPPNLCPDDCDPYAYTNAYGKTLFCQIGCLVKLGKDEVWLEMYRGCVMVIQEPHCMGFSLVIVNEKQVVLAVQKLSRKTDFKMSPHTQYGFLYTAVTTTEKGSLHENFLVSFQCKAHADQFRQVVTACKRIMAMSSGNLSNSNTCPTGTLRSCGDDAGEEDEADVRAKLWPNCRPDAPSGVYRGGAEPCEGGRDFGRSEDCGGYPPCRCEADYGRDYDGGGRPGGRSGYRYDAEDPGRVRGESRGYAWSPSKDKEYRYVGPRGFRHGYGRDDGHMGVVPNSRLGNVLRTPGVERPEAGAGGRGGGGPPASQLRESSGIESEAETQAAESATEVAVAQ